MNRLLTIAYWACALYIVAIIVLAAFPFGLIRRRR